MVEYIVKMKSHSIVWSGGSGYPFGNGVGGQGDPAPHYTIDSVLRDREVGQAKDLSALPRMIRYSQMHSKLLCTINRLLVHTL